MSGLNDSQIMSAADKVYVSSARKNMLIDLLGYSKTQQIFYG